MKARRTYRLLIVLLIAASAVVCYGKVFRRIGGYRGAMPAGRLKTSTAYRSDIQINDGQATLQVLGWNDNLDTVVPILRETWFSDKDAQLVRNAAGAFGVVCVDDTIMRLLVSEIDGSCIALRIEQSTDEFDRSSRAPARHRLTSYPNSTPVFFMKNEDTRTAIELSNAYCDPDAAYDALDSSMTEEGWLSPFPLQGAIQRRMNVYLRNKELCLVFAGGSQANGRSTVVVLHKTMKTEIN